MLFEAPAKIHPSHNAMSPRTVAERGDSSDHDRRQLPAHYAEDIKPQQGSAHGRTTECELRFGLVYEHIFVPTTWFSRLLPV